MPRRHRQLIVSTMRRHGGPTSSESLKFLWIQIHRSRLALMSPTRPGRRVHPEVTTEGIPCETSARMWSGPAFWARVTRSSSITRSFRMKLALSAALVLLLSGLAFADGDHGMRRRTQIADSSAACLANCDSQNASCKRACPATLSTPCLSACDSQAQTCRRSCQSQ